MDNETIRHRYASGWIRASGEVEDARQNKILLSDEEVFFAEGGENLNPNDRNYNKYCLAFRRVNDSNYWYATPEQITLNLSRPASGIVDYHESVLFIRHTAERYHKRCSCTQNTIVTRVLEDFLNTSFVYGKSLIPTAKVSPKISGDIFRAWCRHSPQTMQRNMLHLTAGKCFARSLTRYFWISLSYVNKHGFTLWYRSTPVGEISASGKEIKASPFFKQEVQDLMRRLQEGDVHVFV